MAHLSVSISIPCLLSFVITSAVAADPLLEQIIAGRLKLNAQLQQCHIEINEHVVHLNGIDESNARTLLNSALAKGDLFKTADPQPTIRFLKDGKRWQWMSCGGVSTLDDQLGALAHSPGNTKGAARPGFCRFLLSDGKDVYASGSSNGIINMEFGPVIRSSPRKLATVFVNLNPWFSNSVYDADGAVSHPVDPVLTAVSGALAGKRSDVRLEEVIFDGKPLVKAVFKYASPEVIKIDRMFIMDPARSFATVTAQGEESGHIITYATVLEWMPDRNFARRAASVQTFGGPSAYDPNGKTSANISVFHVTRVNLETAPDFKQYPIEVAKGTAYTSNKIDPGSEEVRHADDRFRVTRTVALDEWDDLNRSLFANPGQGDVAPLKPPAKPGTSYAVWGLLAAGVACILAAIWTLRSRSR